jgi:hypothetical protein
VVLDHESIPLRFLTDVVFKMRLFVILGRRYVLFVLVDFRIVFLEPDLRFLAYRVRRFLKRGILAGKCWGGVALSGVRDPEIKVET